jgi:hypothetical protein
MSNVGLDVFALAKSIAKTIIEDEKMTPICITERTSSVSSPFCGYFYQAYQQELGNNGQPTFNHVVHSVNLSYSGAMESEFLGILRQLYEDGYEPDSFITFSEHLFSIINNVSR